MGHGNSMGKKSLRKGRLRLWAGVGLFGTLLGRRFSTYWAWTWTFDSRTKHQHQPTLTLVDPKI